MRREAWTSLFYFIKNCFIFGYTGLCCCTQAFSSCGKRWPLFTVAHGLLTVVASGCGAEALGAGVSVAAQRL